MGATSSTGKWSIPEAANAVKVAFFGSEGIKDRLRNKDIREAVQGPGKRRPIAATTLSKALKQLQATGELEREAEGREVWYRLTIGGKLNWERDRDTVLAADQSAIMGAAQLGGITDRKEGWAVYGIPRILRNRLRPQLRTACLDFEDLIEKILVREAGSIFQRIGNRARNRGVPAYQVKDGLQALREEFRDLLDWRGEFRADAWGLFYLERFAPGAAGAILSDPVVAGSSVIVAVTSKEALLQAFDAATGDPLWNYLPASGG